MRRRSRLATAFVALLVVGLGVVTTQPRGSALAADPQAELARTQEQLAAAQAARSDLQRRIAQQRAQLADLEARSADLSSQLDIAKAELSEVTAEYERVRGLLEQVRHDVAEITAQLALLEAQIEELDTQLVALADQISARSAELNDREALLQEHLRAAYEQSRTSLLEVLLAADSLDEATTQVNYLLTVSDQDASLAGEIRTIRQELATQRASLREGRRTLAVSRAAAQDEREDLEARQAELTVLEAQLEDLRVAAERKRAEQAQLLNESIDAEADVEAQIASNQRAAAAAADLAQRLQSQAAAQQAAIEEARRRAAAEAAEAARQAAANATSSYGFRWAERAFHVTQEWGPTSFVLEPSYTYRGTFYPHFHAGIDFANGCGTPIYAVGAGVVVASGQPLMPFDSGYGVVIDHGGGVQTWYWHMQARVVVAPGQIVTSQSLIGYEGSTGNSTGCHVHFAVNDHGVWENPRNYLP
jgi:murein DD-endopeptidase MepM/ murein hydrolase activator NlpD